MTKCLFFGKVPPPFTGMTVITQTVLTLMAESGKYEVQIINTSSGKLQSQKWHGRIGYSVKQLFNVVNKYILLNNALKRMQPDVLYYVASSTFFGNASDLLMTKVAARYKVKMVAHLHNGNFRNNFEQFRLLGGGAALQVKMHKFLFGSPGLRNDLKNYIPDSKTSIVVNPIDSGLRCSSELIEQKIDARLKQTGFILTYLSNFIESKGYKLLKEAVELLGEKAQSLQLKVRFIGAWPSKAEEESFLQSLRVSKIQGVFEHIGPVRDREKVKAYLLESDIFCLPTFYPVEAQPVSIIEAMNCGNAILSTEHASIPEIVRHQTDGYLVPKQNTQALSEALEDMLNKQEIAHLARNARSQYVSTFSPEVVLKQFEQAFL